MNLAKYGLRGKMGTGFPDDLKPLPNPPIVNSYHVIDMGGEDDIEVAIRYHIGKAQEVADLDPDYRGIVTKPIFRQFPIGEN